MGFKYAWRPSGKEGRHIGGLWPAPLCALRLPGASSRCSQFFTRRGEDPGGAQSLMHVRYAAIRVVRHSAAYRPPWGRHHSAHNDAAVINEGWSQLRVGSAAEL